jgi:hypothetical protein
VRTLKVGGWERWEGEGRTRLQRKVTLRNSEACIIYNTYKRGRKLLHFV